MLILMPCGRTARPGRALPVSPLGRV